MSEVYAAIASVSAELSRVGIGKDRKNDQQGYKFRGIDDVYNALGSVLPKHGLVILPDVLERTVTERTTAKGGVLFYVVLKVRFVFVSAKDDSRHDVVTFGEAMDSGDKATNKAMSAAYKYAAMMTFAIPTEGDHDADTTTHEVVASKPAGYDDWQDAMTAAADEGTLSLRNAWKSSAAVYRDHAAKDAAWVAALKTRAAQVVAA